MKHKRVRRRGKISLSKLFSEIKEGDRVALVRNPSFKASFPERLHGNTGKVIGKRGRAIILEVSDLGKKKTFIVKKIHLKKLSS